MFDKEKIDFHPKSKHISVYRGIMCQQRPEALPEIYRLIQEEEVEVIVEVGTAFGGLSLYLADRDYCEIHTFDIVDKNPSLPINNKLFKYLDDAFSESCKEKITKITQDKKTLWLFDGGNKMKEVKFYSDIVKKGELVMLHDFAPDSNSFKYLKDNNIWLWHESNSSEINFNLYEEHKNFEKLWKTIVWGCFRKK